MIKHIFQWCPGELDDNLVPVGKEMFDYEEEEDWAEDDDTSVHARPGTIKRKQHYVKKVHENYNI